MFFIHLKQAENNKDTYNIKLLMNVVIFETIMISTVSHGVCAVKDMAQ